MTLLKRLFLVVLILALYAFYLYQTMKHLEKDSCTVIPDRPCNFDSQVRPDSCAADIDNVIAIDSSTIK